MKKVFVTGIVLVIFVIYAIMHHNTTPVTSGPNPRSSYGTPTKTGVTFKDGTYTGSAADAFYGILQVKAIVQNGKIADVQFLQYPHDQEQSVQINQSAMPTLKQEAIQAQSQNVDIVSGATQTSQAFQQSLASALAQAK